jgi:hypothetical protein
MKTAQINTEYNQRHTMNPAYKSGDAWVRIAALSDNASDQCPRRRQARLAPG